MSPAEQSNITQHSICIPTTKAVDVLSNNISCTQLPNNTIA